MTPPEEFPAPILWAIRIPMLLAMAGLGALYLVSGLVVPTPWLAPLWFLYGVWVVLMVRWWRRPIRLVLVPVGLIATWFAYVNLGGWLLGWTA